MRIFRWIRTAITRPGRIVRVAIHHALVSPSVCNLFEAAGGTRLLALLTALAIDDEGLASRRPSVLVLDRLYFAKDVVELRRRGRLYNYINLDTHILSTVQALWLPGELQEQVSYAPRTLPEHANDWAKAENYVQQLLEAALRRWNIVAVLSSNVDYWQHEAVRRVCRKINVPFVVLCQELQSIDWVYDHSIKLYTDANFRFSGAAVAVFGQRTKEMLVESQCNTEDEVWVTGAPRLDPWFDGTVDSAIPADTITLLAFDGDQYFAPNCYLDALRVFAEASIRHRDSGKIFLLKCKDAEDERRARSHLSGVAHNLTITNARSLIEIFPRSRLVLGYNSLAIVEALFSPAELAVPQWSDAARPVAEQLIDPTSPEYRRHFRFLDLPQAWADLIDEAIASPRPAVDLRARAAVVEHWFHVPAGGSATQATEDFIAHYVRRAAGSNQSTGSQDKLHEALNAAE
jgi:hypothetical protein